MPICEWPDNKRPDDILVGFLFFVISIVLFVFVLLWSANAATLVMPQQKQQEELTQPVLPPSSVDKEYKAVLVDKLFEDLKNAEDSQSAVKIAQILLDYWSKPTSPTTKILWDRVNDIKTSTVEDTKLKIELYTKIIETDPDFLEAYNRRSLLYFQQHNYWQSIYDVYQVLKREPRHFNARIGLITNMKFLGRMEDALRECHKILEVYPLYSSVLFECMNLEEMLSKNSI